VAHDPDDARVIVAAERQIRSRAGATHAGNRGQSLEQVSEGTARAGVVPITHPRRATWAVTTFSGLNPGSTRSKRAKLMVSSPAP